MSLIRKSNQEREFPPVKIKEVLSCLKDEHYDIITSRGMGDRWIEFSSLWALIEKNIDEQIQYHTTGTIRSLSTLRLSDLCTKGTDPVLSMAGIILDKHILDGLLNRHDLEALIEDFFLKTYKLNPRFIPCKIPNYAHLIFPGPIYSILTGYPSPKQVEKRFLELTSDFACFEFQSLRRGRHLWFSFSLVPVDDTEDLDTEYVNVGAELINAARRSTV